MRHAPFSMRWWLALAFAGIAALTALAVAQVFTARSESAIRERAQELVAGAAVAAAAQISPRATVASIRESAARRVRIEIADQGPGMKREDAEKALDRFYRARASNGEGFGLGLSIVREVVRVMNGTLTIDSQLGKGTTVSIELESMGNGRECP